MVECLKTQLLLFKCKRDLIGQYKSTFMNITKIKEIEENEEWTVKYFHLKF